MSYELVFYDAAVASAPPQRIFTESEDDLRLAGKSPRVRTFAVRLLAEIPDVEDLEYEDASDDPIGHFFVLHLPLAHDEAFAESVIALAESVGLSVYDPQGEDGEDGEDEDWIIEIFPQASEVRAEDLLGSGADGIQREEPDEQPYLLLVFDAGAAQATGAQVFAMVARNPYEVRAGKSRRVTRFMRRLDVLSPDAWDHVGLNFSRAADYTNYVLAYLPAPDGGSARAMFASLAQELGLAVHDPQVDPSGGGPEAFWTS